MNNDQSYGGTQAIHRAVAVLRAFGAAPATLTAQEVSQRTGLNRSTVYRLLSALESEGLVAAAEQGRYRLGPDLAMLGTLALRQMNLRDLALPYARALAERSGETIDLEILHGASSMIVEEVSGEHLLSAASNIGACYPAHCSSTGKALLAFLPEARLAALLPDRLEACAPRSITDHAALRDELAAVRARGYATSYDELEGHLHALGAPIFDHRGEAVAALSISGPAARLPRRREAELARVLLEACAAISRQLGFRPDMRPDPAAS
ncbi:IclR family transcriptional regulator [Kouleothrix sp.]|uniref:IclR family transcriptional regulator n=1 Tax=Kouleothrix sp. TaxID=2779161 RepID=UPI00391D8930